MNLLLPVLLLVVVGWFVHSQSDGEVEQPEPARTPVGFSEGHCLSFLRVARPGLSVNGVKLGDSLEYLAGVLADGVSLRKDEDFAFLDSPDTSMMLGVDEKERVIALLANQRGDCLRIGGKPALRVGWHYEEATAFGLVHVDATRFTLESAEGALELVVDTDRIRWIAWRR